MKIKKLGALLVSAALCVGMAAPAFAFEGEAAPVEKPVLPEVVEEDVVTITDETSGALTPEGNLTLVDDYHTNYSDGSGQQFITLVSKSGATFYLVDAADDLKKDAASGNYNPVALRFGLTDGIWTAEARREFAATLDHSIHMMATAFELWDFGVWTPILEKGE